MLKHLFVLLCLCLFSHLFGQQPDTVRIDGAAFFVYPIPSAVTPNDYFLDRFGLDLEAFVLYRKWVDKQDPRIRLPYQYLKEALKDDLIDSLRMPEYSYDFDEDYYEEYYVPLSKRSKRRYEQLQVAKKIATERRLEQSLPSRIEEFYEIRDQLPPVVSSLPDGDYVQYFETFFTYTCVDNSEKLPARIACRFSLKDNLLNGSFWSFSFAGDTLVSGNYENGIKAGEWVYQLYSASRKSDRRVSRPNKKTLYRTDHDGYDLKYAERTPSFTEVLFHHVVRIGYRNGLVDGDYSLTRNGQLLQKGQFRKGLPTGSWYYCENQVVKFTYNQDTISYLPHVLYNWERSDYNVGGKSFLRMEDELVFLNFEKAVTSWPLKTDDPKLDKLSDNNPLWKDAVVSNYRHYVPFFAGTLVVTSVNDTSCILARFTALPDIKVIVGQRFYTSGQRCDTLGINPDTREIVYEKYDKRGELLVANKYNLSGVLVDSYQRDLPPVKHIDTREIEGVLALKEMGTNRWVSYNTENDGTLMYRRKVWDPTGKNRIRVDIEDTVSHKYYDRRYNKSGEQVLEIVTRRHSDYETLSRFIKSSEFEALPLLKRDSILGYYSSEVVLKIQNESIDWKWGDFTFSGRYGKTKGENTFYLSEKESRYTGPAVFYFKDRLLLRESKKGVVFSAPRLPESEAWEPKSDHPSKQRQLLAIDLEADSNNPWYIVVRGLFGGYLFYKDIEKISGDFFNGKPNGWWKYYLSDGTCLFELNYVDGIPSGTIRVLNYNETVVDWSKSEKSKEKKRFESRYLILKCDTVPVFKEYEYTIRAGKFDGVNLQFNCVGDTIGKIGYRDGTANGIVYTRIDARNNSEDYTEYFGNMLNKRLDRNFIAVRTRHIPVLSDSLGESSPIDGETDELYAIDSWVVLKDTTHRYCFDNGKLSGPVCLKFGKSMLTGQFDQGKLQGEFILSSEQGREFSATYDQDHLVSFSSYHEGVKTGRYSFAFGDSVHIRWLEELKEIEGSRADNFQLIVKNTHWPQSDDWYNSAELERKCYYTRYYPNDKLQREGAIFKGKQRGLWKYYAYDGKLLSEIFYFDSLREMKFNGRSFVVSGILTENDSLGHVLSERWITESMANYECSSDEYFPVRQYVVVQDTPGDGVERSNGLIRNYYDHGALMSEGILKNGVPEGLWKWYTQDGKLFQLGKYQDGKKQGRWLVGDLSDKAYIGDVCMDPDQYLSEYRTAQLERELEIEVQVYDKGVLLVKNQFEIEK